MCIQTLPILCVAQMSFGYAEIVTNTLKIVYLLYELRFQVHSLYPFLFSLTLLGDACTLYTTNACRLINMKSLKTYRMQYPFILSHSMVLCAGGWSLFPHFHVIYRRLFTSLRMYEHSMYAVIIISIIIQNCNAFSCSLTRSFGLALVWRNLFGSLNFDASINIVRHIHVILSLCMQHTLTHANSTTTITV